VKKFILGYLIILLIFGLFIIVASERIEKINNGEITVISESYKD